MRYFIKSKTWNSCFSINKMNLEKNLPKYWNKSNIKIAIEYNLQILYLNFIFKKNFSDYLVLIYILQQILCNIVFVLFYN